MNPQADSSLVTLTMRESVATLAKEHPCDLWSGILCCMRDRSESDPGHVWSYTLDTTSIVHLQPTHI